MDRTQVKIWTDGRKGCVVCITGTAYETGAIVVGTEQSKMTEYQMLRALNEEYPNVEFNVFREEGDMLIARSN